MSQPVEAFRNAFKIPELRQRILFTLGILAVYRLGTFVATPGVNGQALLEGAGKVGGFLSLYDLFSGGGLRRATLRGRLNLTKRQIGAAIAFNFSLLMRHLHGIGTPKQWEAAVAALIERLSNLVGTLRTTLGALLGLDPRTGFRSELSGAIRQNLPWGILTAKATRISTGC